jgi:hypothetical protein
MTPSLEIGNGNWAVKSDSLLGYKTINGKYYPREMSVTRATTATRVNAAGLVELVPYNLLEYSEQFENSYWVKDSGVSVNSNASIAPNGTNTADRLNLSTGGAVYRSALALGTGSFTLSVWLKGEGSNIGKQVLLEFTNGNSTVTLTGDWQRFTTVGSNASFAAIKRNTVGQADSVLAWGIQLVEGTQALDYLPTTDRLDIARIDYSTGEAALLVEPQRTNLVTWSEDFSNVVWTKTAGVSVTSDSSISPSGVQNADTIVGATGPYVFGGNNTFARGVSGLSSSTAYIFTVYLKGSGSVTITCRDGGTGLTNNIVCALTSSWQRFEISRTTAVASTALAYVFSDASGNFDIWGAQLELGAYQTSYIPTTSTSVTRNADVISRSNIFTNGYITSAGGTWFVDFKGNVDLIRSGSSGGVFLNTGIVALAGDGFLFRNPTTSSQKISIIKYNSGTPSTLYNTLTENVKAAIKWNGTTADIFVNGVKVVTATAFTVTNMENLIGEGQNRTLQINSMSLYTTPLSDTECINLTTI